MEAYPEKYHILEPNFITRIKSFARFMTHQETELCLSEHIRERGAEAMLAQPELPFEPHAVSEGWLAYDSEGNYLDREF